MSIAALAGGVASEHNGDMHSSRPRTGHPRKRYGIANDRQENIQGVLFGNDDPDDRFRRPENPGSHSHWQIGDNSRPATHREPATDIYGGRIESDSDDEGFNSRPQHQSHAEAWTEKPARHHAKGNSDSWQAEGKHNTHYESKHRDEGKHGRSDQHRADDDEFEEFRRWKQQKDREKQQDGRVQRDTGGVAHDTRAPRGNRQAVPQLDLQQPGRDNRFVNDDTMHDPVGSDVQKRQPTESKTRHGSDEAPNTSRRDTRDIPLHAKIESIRFFIERRSQAMIKALTSSERLSIRGPDLRKVMRRRALNSVFQNVIAENARRSRNAPAPQSSRRPGSRRGASSIDFGGGRKTGGGRVAQGSAARGIRQARPRTGGAPTRAPKRGKDSKSTAIMEHDFIKAVQSMTLYDSPPLTDDQAAQLWHSCQGDYSNFIKVVFPSGTTKKNAPKSARTHRGTGGARSGLAFGADSHDPAIRSIKAAAKLNKARPQIMKGPWNRTGKGVRTIKAPAAGAIPHRMQYRFSRTTVQPPSDFKRSDIPRSAQLPQCHLDLQHVYGFRGQDYASHGNALYVSPLGEAVYFAAGVGIVMDVNTREQRFLMGHSDDITVMSINSRKDLVVTGQMSPRSCLYVWSLNSCKLLKKVGFTRTTKAHGVQKRQPYYERWVCAACFTHDSRYVIGVGCNDSHMLAVWHIGSQVKESTLVCEYPCQNGAPPKVYGAVSSSKTSIGLVSTDGREHYFLTFGEIHLKFWTLRPKATQSHEKITMTPASYKSYPKPRETLCAAFLPSGHAVTGGSNGMVYMWWNAECVHAFQAHDNGPCSAIAVIDETETALDFEMPRPGALPAGAAQEMSESDAAQPKVPALFGLDRITQPISFFTGGTDGMVIAWQGTSGSRSSTGAQTSRHTYRDFQPVAKISLLQEGGSIQASSYYDTSTGNALGASAPSASRSQSFAARERHLRRGGAKGGLGLGRSKKTAAQAKASAKNSRPFLIQSLDYHGGYLFAATTEDTLWTIGCQGSASSSKPMVPLSARSRGSRRGIGSPRSSGVPGVDRPSSSLGRALSLSGHMFANSHFGGLYGLAAHPARKNIFVTLGADRQVVVWDAERRKPLFRSVLPAGQMVVSCAAIHPQDDHMAVGFDNGAVIVYDLSEALQRSMMNGSGTQQPRGREQSVLTPGSVVSLPEVSRWQHSKEGVSVMKYSPDGSMLAVGTKDCPIDLYKISRQTRPGHGRVPLVSSSYAFCSRLTGHSASVLCLDWSANSKLLQSNCANYEIIYWDADRGAPIASLNDAIERDTDWHTWSCILGFPVMGIWPDYSDGSDVNALMLTRDKRYVVTADDHGKIKLFNAPCVVEDAPSLTYAGHSSHVTGVTFLKGDSHVISVGGLDEAVFQWEYVPQIYQDANKAAQARQFTVKNFASTRPW